MKSLLISFCVRDGEIFVCLVNGNFIDFMRVYIRVIYHSMMACYIYTKNPSNKALFVKSLAPIGLKGSR